MKWLKNCYDSLRRQSFKNFEVILVDNASSDDSVKFTREFYPEVKIMRNEKNLGYAEANNRAGHKAQGEYLLFLNNDTKLKYNCLEELAKYARDRKCYICTVNFLDYTAKISQTPEKSVGLGIDIFGYPLLSKKIFYADGAALFIKKEVFLKLNGFDPEYFIFAEDIDLSWRAYLLGYNIDFVKSAIVYHEKGGTVTGSAKKHERHVTSIKRRYLTERNTLSNLLKNYGFFMLIFILPIQVILLVVELTFFLLRRERKIVKEVYYKALAYNVLNFWDILERRRKIQKERVISDFGILKKITLFRFYKLEVFKKIGIPIIK